MRIVIHDGRTFSGTATQIVRQMQSLTFDQKDGELGDYINWVVDNARRMHEADLTISGETDDERCASLIEEMKRTGLAK